MKTILATAYAINPFKGSEDGMGWNFVMQIARFNKVIAITRVNNKPHIEKFMQAYPCPTHENITFLYFDLPAWIRFWKKGNRGAMLYYLLWQYGIVRFIKKQMIHYDIVHNLNFHNDWTPSFLWKLKKPFVWGPIGHHPPIPSEYLTPYAKSYLIKDKLSWWLKNYFWKYSFNLLKTKRKAAHVFCMNSSVPNTIRLNKNFSFMPSVATQDMGWNMAYKQEKFTLITAGRFVPLKGFDLAILSFARFINQCNPLQKQTCELIIIGSGPEESFLKKLIIANGLESHVRLISWVNRDVLMNLFKNASAFLFPSHEGAGMVVAEALSFGLPVICLDNAGPGQFINDECGYRIAPGNYDTTIQRLSDAIKDLFNHPAKHLAFRYKARQQFENFFHWDKRGETLQQIYACL